MRGNLGACDSFNAAMSRRSVLKSTLAGFVPWLVSGSAISQVALGKEAEPDHVLVLIFLRGGADGLNILAPYADDHYQRARPSLGLSGNEVTKLTDYFGLHPELARLKEWWDKKSLAIYPAVGSQDTTRSHFEAMSAMERGAANGLTGEPSGWLARYMTATRSETGNPVRAVSFSSVLPDSLRGGPQPLVAASLQEFKFDLDDVTKKYLREAYARGDSVAHRVGRSTLNALERIASLDPARYQPSGGANYGTSDLGQGLKESCALIKAGLGTEIICLESDGWDTHVAQGPWLASKLKEVGESVHAFMTDLGSHARRVTTIVMTEFGRRIGENAGQGTDHGRASVMLVFQEGNGGQIKGEWPGIGPGDVDSVGDLRPVNDYRAVLTEVLSPRMPAIKDVWA